MGHAASAEMVARGVKSNGVMPVRTRTLAQGVGPKSHRGITHRMRAVRAGEEGGGWSGLLGERSAAERVLGGR